VRIATSCAALIVCQFYRQLLVCRSQQPRIWLCLIAYLLVYTIIHPGIGFVCVCVCSITWDSFPFLFRIVCVLRAFCAFSCGSVSKLTVGSGTAGFVDDLML